MPSEQDIPLYTTDPTTGELVPVENGQYLSQAEIERRRYFQKKKQQQAICHAANDERTRKFWQLHILPLHALCSVLGGYV